jgi:peptidoglycan endopeptidase LytE
MMRRRIFLWMGLSVLFVLLGFSGDGLARETYQVRPGDTLFDVSEKMGVSLKALKAANRLQSSKLKPDQVLVIPTPKANEVAKSVKSPSLHKKVYAVRKGDTLAGIAKKTGTSVAKLRDLNLLQGSALKIGQILNIKTRQDREALSVSETVVYTKNEFITEHEEEEDEGIEIASEEARAGIERQKKGNESLLGNWSSPDEQQLLVKAATGFLGAPYRLGGFSMKGLDCSGLVKKIYQTFNIDLPRTAFEQSHVGLRVARSKLTEGDLLFFNTRRAFGHVGIYIGNNQFVHASSRNRGVRIDDLNTPYYNKRFVRANRLKGNDDGM